MIAASAVVDVSVNVPDSASIWDLARIRENAILGERVTVGQGVYLGVGVTIGNDTKVQNAAQIFEPAEIGQGVFIGPGVILTNDHNPRAVTPTMRQKTAGHWTPVGVRIMNGASIGAGAICVAPVTVGRWAMVGAGAVVTRDVPDHALVVGVPARQIGWVGRAGARLAGDLATPTLHRCPVTGELYKEIGSGLGLIQGYRS